MSSYSQEVEVRGHLIDSMILSKIFDVIMDMRGEFEVLEFSVGKRKDEHSFVRLLIKADSREKLERMLDAVYRMGAVPAGMREASLAEAPADGVPPEDFYVTTNNPTQVYVGGRWMDVRPVAANMAIVYSPSRGEAEGRPPWRVRRGELVFVGEEGIRVNPPERPREGVGIFEFMSAPTPKAATPSLISGLAEEMKSVRERGGRIVLVAGAAVARSGASDSLASLVRRGYVDALVSDGSLLTCDVELRLFGTCDGIAVLEGARSGYGNRVRAAVELRRAGGVEGLIKRGALRGGLAY
ncbi:MAG: TIGR00300 family protein, partial [Conexivisphaera sp.]